MTRISLVDAYDNRDVIVQIENLKKGKQDKLNAGTGVTIEGNTINVDTSDLATKVELTTETARLDQKIDDVDNKIPPLASKAELADESARLDARVDAVDAKIPPLASKEELNQQTARLDARVDAVDAKIPPLASKAELTDEVSRLDTRIDDVDAKIPPLASKAELANEATRLDAKIERGDQDLSSRIDASNVKIKTNADAILNIEDELGSDASPGTIYYRISKVENDVIILKPLVNDSINKVDVEGDASTVYHKASHNSGIVENDALPVASDTKAGVMSASMYVGFNGSIQNLQARMAVLEGVGITYQLSGLPDNPSDAQITSAFREQYPNVPLSAGIRVADYDKAKIWQYSGTAWIQLTSLNIDKATSTSLGVVMGSVTSDTNEGKIFVEVDGTMAVIGWDTLKALATATKQSVDNLEPRVTQQSAKIDVLEGNVAGNTSDITTLEGTSADHESRISSLETTSADLGTRMSSAETDIDTLQTSDAQQTSKITSLETTSASHGSKISALEKTSANQGDKISSLETTSTNQGTKITSLETTSANHESRISSLETTSSALGTRMSGAEQDIDTLQASDAQHTTKISALEADMNNVKPRVGQLESDVGALNTKVNQQTQSISGLSTEVNSLKTTKQDKLIAGDGITIDQNVISSVSTPNRRVIEGYASVSNEIRNFLANARPGSTFEIYERIRLTDTSYDDCVTIPPRNAPYRFGNMSVTGVRWKPRTPITMLSEYSYTDQDGKEFLAKTFAFYGYVYWSTEGTSTRPSKVGWIYFTRIQNVASPNNFSVTMTPYASNDSSANNVRFYNGVLYDEITNTSDFDNYIAIVNY